jgi:hypothetical protein
MATRPPPSPEQLAQHPPSVSNPLAVPPWSMSQAMIGWNLKSGLHRLQEAMQVRAVCAGFLLGAFF